MIEKNDYTIFETIKCIISDTLLKWAMFLLPERSSDREKMARLIIKYIGFDSSMSLWVWDNAVSTCSDGYAAFVFAETEEEAWRMLKKKNHVAWCILRGRPEYRDDKTPCEEIEANLRPRKVTSPEAFTCWVGD